MPARLADRHRDGECDALSSQAPTSDNRDLARECQDHDRPVVITLLGEPVAAGRPRFSRTTGMVYTPPKTRLELNAIRLLAQQAMTGRLPLDGPLEVEYLAERQVPLSWSRRRRLQALNGTLKPTSRPDADNLLKCLDALTHVVWKDDAQICKMSFEKRFSEQPKTIISVWPLP